MPAVHGGSRSSIGRCYGRKVRRACPLVRVGQERIATKRGRSPLPALTTDGATWPRARCERWLILSRHHLASRTPTARLIQRNNAPFRPQRPRSVRRPPSRLPRQPARAPGHRSQPRGRPGPTGVVSVECCRRDTTTCAGPPDRARRSSTLERRGANCFASRSLVHDSDEYEVVEFLDLNRCTIQVGQRPDLAR